MKNLSYIDEFLENFDSNVLIDVQTKMLIEKDDNPKNIKLEIKKFLNLCSQKSDKFSIESRNINNLIYQYWISLITDDLKSIGKREILIYEENEFLKYFIDKNHLDCFDKFTLLRNQMHEKEFNEFISLYMNYNYNHDSNIIGNFIDKSSNN